EGPTDPQQGAARARGLGQAEIEITRKVKRAISDVQAVLERENQRVRVSLSLSSVMGQLHKLGDVVRGLMVRLLCLVPADGAGLALLGEQGKPILVETLRRDTGGAFQVSGSLLAAALVARVPVVSGNVAADPKWQGETTLIGRGVRSVMISAL